MATISATVQIITTLATLDAQSIATILAWVETNIRSKIPLTATMTVNYTINP